MVPNVVEIPRSAACAHNTKLIATNHGQLALSELMAKTLSRQPKDNTNQRTRCPEVELVSAVLHPVGQGKKSSCNEDDAPPYEKCRTCNSSGYDDSEDVKQQRRLHCFVFLPGFFTLASRLYPYKSSFCAGWSEGRDA